MLKCSYHHALFQQKIATKINLLAAVSLQLSDCIAVSFGAGLLERTV